MTDGNSVIFRRSSYCSFGTCVEVALTEDRSVLVRDSQRPSSVLRFTAEEWAAFVTGVKNGEFDIDGA